MALVEGARDARRSAMRSVASWLVVGAVLLGGHQANADGDAAAGKTVFENQCASCHSTVAGGEGFGPSLAAVIGRKSGAAAGFGYSAAMANAGLTWDTATIDAFLTSTTQKVPGTSMSVEISAAADRSNVIAYLQTLGQAAAVSAPAPTAPGNAAPAEGPTQAQLLRAAPDTHNWLYTSKDDAAQLFVDLSETNEINAGGLLPVCICRSINAG